MEENKGQDKQKNLSLPTERVLAWSILLTIFLASVLVVFGLDMPFFVLIIVALGIIIAYRYPYFTFYLAIFFLPFLGMTISIPTGNLQLGERAFGGSIDLYLGEGILMMVLGAWVIKIFYLWYKRGDVSWQPKLPIWKAYATLVLAHAISIFSGYGPDQVLVLKFILRPVIFCYVGFVALPTNFIRSRRRLKSVLAILVVVGCLAALNGFISLGWVESVGSFVRRAHPISLFGINPIGDNHNVLAELLLATGPMALALGAMAKKASNRRVLFALAAIQMLVALLTFARTAWLVFMAQAVFMCATIWRQSVKRHLPAIIALILMMLPLAWFQVVFSFSPTAQSSNSTRWMLTDIAYQSFLEYPIIGSGAGTFMERVGNARIFYQEFGDPLDAHGVIQKIMVETGSVGLLAYAIVLSSIAYAAWRSLRQIGTGQNALAAYALVTAAGGALAYQFLNTAYWTAHMWLPVGIMFAGLSVLSVQEKGLTEPDLA